MRAYNFRLHTVLRVRRIESMRARQHVAVVSRHLEATRTKANTLHDQLAADGKRLGDVAGSTFIAEYEHGARLATMLAEATNERSVFEARLLAARIEAATAEQRVQALERLDERRRAEWFTALHRHDANELDDIATIRSVTTSREASRVD